MVVLKKHYTISHDWEGNRYLGIDLDSDYERRKVHLSIILYLKEALIRFNHAVPRHPQYQPHPHIKPEYGRKVQCTKEEDAPPPLTTAKKKLVQEVIGVFLYYRRAINSMMLTALGTISIQQYTPTKNSKQNVHQFLG